MKSYAKAADLVHHGLAAGSSSSVSTTSTPSRASLAAQAAPMPDTPPVTMTALPRT
jgi:hypothetical protein